MLLDLDDDRRTTRPRPTRSGSGATCASFRIAPISNEIVRNNLAESIGLPRSY